MDAKVVKLRDQARGEAQVLDSLQKDLEKIQQARTHFIQQKQENDMVLEELKLLDDESSVYKLIGPALIKQDPLEAKHNVEKRLEFIGHELGRLDGQAKGLDEKRSQKQNQVWSAAFPLELAIWRSAYNPKQRNSDIMRLQEQIQRHAQSAAS